MGLTKALVQEALTLVDHPGAGGADVVSTGALQWVAACDDYASVKLCLVNEAGAAQPGRDVLAGVARAADQAVRHRASRDGLAVSSLIVEFVDHAGNTVAQFGGAPTAAKKAAPDKGESPAPPPSPQSKAEGLPNVANIVAVGAGKGGVGKSTIAVAIAVGLARQGKAVGLLDGDIYGPSLPTMLGLGPMEQAVLDGRLQPFAVHGVKAVTIGKMVEADKPLIWRGPMAHGAFNQLVTRTEWGELDYLIIDLPPGTGDVALTLAQSLALTGAVVVCTPQQVAQDDAVRAARMFSQLGVEVLGVVENMSYFVGDDGKTYDIFGRGGAEQMAQRLGLPFLGGVPINTALRRALDEGEPLSLFDPAQAGGDALPKALEGLIKQFEAQVTLSAMQRGTARPTLNIS